MSGTRTLTALASAALAIGALAVAPSATAAVPAGTLVWSRVSTHFQHQAIVGTVAGEFRALTHPGPRESDIDANVAPDGQHVLFERDFPDGTARVGIVGTDGKGEHLIDLGCTDPCVADTAPTFAADGTHLYWTPVVGPFDQVNGSARQAVLWRAALDGSGRQRVSEPGIDGALEDYHAHPAPGGYLVFVRVRNDQIRTAVFRMNPDGTHVRQLTPYSVSGDLPDISPATSGPTKDLVVFETYGQGAPDGLGQSIATVPATCAPLSSCTAQIKLITPGDDPLRQNFNPTWSPDGTRVAFCHFVIGADTVKGDIWSADYRGNHHQVVSADPRFEYRPSWGNAPTG